MLERSSSIIRVAAIRVMLASFVFAAAHSEADTKTDGRTHHLGILVGGGVASYREDLIVPMSFDGPAFFLGGQYSTQTARSSFQVRFRAAVAILENRYSHEAYAAVIAVRPSWVKLVRGDAHGSQVWAGVALPLHMTNLLVNSWDESHLYWLTAHSLALVGEYHTSAPRVGHLVLRLELPVVGLVSRPPTYRYHKQEPLTHWTYHVSGPNRSLKLKGLWEFQSPMLQLMISHGSQRSLLSVGVEFELEHCSVPRDIWGLNTRLVFVYQWRIG